MSIVDTQSRKYQLTINNPKEVKKIKINDIETSVVFTHIDIKNIISSLKSCVYWCMCDEIGGETNTYHTHLFICFSSAVRFSTVKKKFPTAHIEFAKGTSQQNKDYVTKTGKWENDKKHETNISETFEEFGEMPVERQGKRNDLDDLYDMIKSGMTNFEIVTSETQYLFDIDKIERARKVIREDEYKNKWRDVVVHYVYGVTGTGKTRLVMDKYGYDNVCKITNYNSHPFDDYQGENVILFDEYRSSFELKDMLNYLDGYPLKLPARYSNRVACYTIVYIISNISLQQQHKRIQENEIESWHAFLRRIKDVTYYNDTNDFITYEINHNTFQLNTTSDLLKERSKSSINHLEEKFDNLRLQGCESYVL